MAEDFGTLLRVLGEASPWVILVAVLLLFIYGFHKMWWVPGFVYQREVKRADINDLTVDSATATITASKEAAIVQAKAQSDMARELRSLQRRLDRSNAEHESHR